VDIRDNPRTSASGAAATKTHLVQRKRIIYLYIRVRNIYVYVGKVFVKANIKTLRKRIVYVYVFKIVIRGNGSVVSAARARIAITTFFRFALIRRLRWNRDIFILLYLLLLLLLLLLGIGTMVILLLLLWGWNAGRVHPQASVFKSIGSPLSSARWRFYHLISNNLELHGRIGYLVNGTYSYYRVPALLLTVHKIIYSFNIHIIIYITIYNASMYINKKRFMCMCVCV
jgi:hypothetical protein